MTPDDVGRAYDRITHLWQAPEFDRSNGIPQHRRALSYVQSRGRALDVGCGCTGRIIDLAVGEGFAVDGIDISEQMLRIARARHPGVAFYRADIGDWRLPVHYDFISAWDCLWHVRLDQQEPVLWKLIHGLRPRGVLVFSFGATDKPSAHCDDAMGPMLYYASLGVARYLEVVARTGARCRHLEYDQQPGPHAYMIVQRA